MFASISDQLINTAIILDMMFNTEMIVKDMKGGKEDMTEKRYKMINTNLADENGRIYYNIQREDGFNICQVYGKYTAKSLIDELNELAEEKKELQFQCNYLQEGASEFYRGARENANMVGQLKRENKKLKDENEQLRKENENLQWKNKGDV